MLLLTYGRCEAADITRLSLRSEAQASNAGSSRMSSNVRLAPASMSFAGAVKSTKPNTVMPAAQPASTPFTESSTTAVRAGAAPMRSAANKKMSGAGLPRGTSRRAEQAPLEERHQLRRAERDPHLVVAAARRDAERNRERLEHLADSFDGLHLLAQHAVAIRAVTLERTRRRGRAAEALDDDHALGERSAEKLLARLGVGQVNAERADERAEHLEDDALAVDDDAVAVEDDEIETCHQSSSVRRSRFKRPCFVLLSSRRACDARVGFVLRRTFGTTSARRTRSAKRSSAAALFCSWLRNCCALMTTTPSAEMR